MKKLVLILCLIVMSCGNESGNSESNKIEVQKESKEEVQKENQSNENGPDISLEGTEKVNVSVDIAARLKELIANSMDISSDRVVYNEKDTCFIVDKDGIIDYVDAYLKFRDILKGVRGQATGVTQMISYYKIKGYDSVRFYVDNTVPQIWVEALDSAIKEMNSDSVKHRLGYVRQKSSTGLGLTRVTTNYSVSSVVATAAYPDYYGKPGNRILINTYNNNLSMAIKINSLIHEIGHTIGFSHSDGTYGSLVYNTPTNDPNSVMKSVTKRWAGFSDYDKSALKTVYPKQ